MNEKMKRALLQMYANLDAAGKRQVERGVHDQGARSQVTSGKHLNPVAQMICEDLIEAGYHKNEVYYEGGCLFIGSRKSTYNKPV